MTEKQDYRLLTAKTPEALEVEVRRYLKDGWLLRGVLYINEDLYIREVMITIKTEEKSVKRRGGWSRSESSWGEDD